VSRGSNEVPDVMSSFARAERKDLVKATGREDEFGVGRNWIIARLPSRGSNLAGYTTAMDPSRSSDSYLFRQLARWLVERGYDWHGSPPKLSKGRRLLRLTLLTLGCYLIAPLMIFDFSEVAYTYDEEYFNGRPVAIGPRPYFLVPGAIHDLDYPGGPDYTETAWPFVVWKPLCMLYSRMEGYELPRGWR
jgi:hypothetical protein